MIFGDFHTHTNFCDGKNTPEQMAEAAYDMGFSAFGFSEHGYTPHDLSYCLKDTQAYIERIRVLKEQYRGKMEILLGLELDMYGVYDRAQFDYIIGSKHYIKTETGYFAVDETVDKLRGAGDSHELYRLYYEQITELPDCDIIGHFDLITKLNGTGALFDESDPRYKSAALRALDTLLERNVPFEVNTGVITRGYRSMPYPAPFLLARILEKGGRVILSGDAHSTRDICANFDIALTVLREIGFKKVSTLTGRGMVEQVL